MKTINQTKNGIKAGDKVKYLDGDPHVYRVYAVYTPTKVSIGLRDYPDTEQDFMTNIKEIQKV